MMAKASASTIRQANRRGNGRIIASQSLDESVTFSNGVLNQIRELWEPALQSRLRAQRLRDWHDGNIPSYDMPIMPEKAPEDLKQIRETGITPYARMIVSTLSQETRVEGIELEHVDEPADPDAPEKKSDASFKKAPAWELWQRNGMDGKQIPLMHASFLHGLAYATILPAVGRMDGAKTAQWYPQSALRGIAFYVNPFDEWPELYLDVKEGQNRAGRLEYTIRLIDDAYVHTAKCVDGNLAKGLYLEKSERHDMGLCPVQRYGSYDLDGRALGEVEPVLRLLRRINQDTVDRLVIQRFGAWIVRTIAGMEEPTAQAVKEQMEIWLSVGDFLSSSNENTKFGSLPATPMDGHLTARSYDIRDLAAATQIPAYRMLGLSDNIGADAIKAADKSLDLKKDEAKTVLGEQHEGAMRLMGYAMGNAEIANDFTSRVRWRVDETSSFQSLMQGLAQARNDLDVPPELLWPRIPNWTEADTQRAKVLIAERVKDEEDRAVLMGLVEGSGSNVVTPGATGKRAPAAAGAAR